VLKLIVCCVAAVVLTACQDGKRDETEARYCEMVARWHADEAAGIPPKSRNGWPPYQGECK